MKLNNRANNRNGIRFIAIYETLRKGIERFSESGKSHAGHDDKQT